MAEGVGDAEEFAQIQQLLLAGGYFRARLPSLPPFDKIIGGLAWSITGSNVDVEFDLFYDEDANIGQKIKLSESIERALRTMECPHPLQAHQIQGLDYPALYLVVQWLIQKVLKTREEFGDRLRHFAHFYYEQPAGYERIPDVPAPDASVEGAYAVQRKLRRKPGAQPVDDRAAATRLTLMEYGYRFEPTAATAAAVSSSSSGKSAKGTARGDEAPAWEREERKGGKQTGSEAAADAELASTLADVGDGALSGATAARIVGLRSDEIRDAASSYGSGAEDPMAQRLGALNQQLAAVAKQLEQAEACLAATQARVDEQQAALDAAVEEQRAKEKYNARCRSELAKLDAAVTDPKDKAAVARLVKLLKAIADSKGNETEFKASCKARLAELQALLDKEDGTLLTPEETARIAEVEQAFLKDKEKWDSLRQALGQRSRAVALLKRKIDEIPSRPELLQYEKRFTELYEQVQAKLDETRKFYSSFNVLTDTKKFINKEISLLNSITQQFEAAMGDKRSREAFVRSLQVASEGVNKTLAQVEGKLAAEQRSLQVLSDKHTALVQRQREHVEAVRELQHESERGIELQTHLSTLQQATATS